MVSDKNYTIGSKSRKYKFNLQLDQGVPLSAGRQKILKMGDGLVKVI